MNKLVKNTFLAASALMMFSGCVDNDDFSLPPLNCDERWEANMDVPAVKALNDTDTPFEVTTDSVLEGYVVSSDETGNIYKSISIQDSRENPTAGISLEVDLSNTYTRYPVGSRVLVNLNGLYVAKDRGVYKVGTTFDSNGTIRVGRMPEATALSHIVLACEDAQEIVPVTYSTIAEAMDEAHLNTLVKLENVQFQTAGNGETYYQDEGAFGNAYNRKIVDSEGTTIDLRTSSYADFAADELPDGSGSITVVLSAYTNSNNVTPSTYQMYIRSTDDVNFDQPRFDVVNGDGSQGGSSAAYSACVSDDFESYAEDFVTFDDYINYAYNGDRYWSVKAFQGNKYLQMSSYNSGGANDVYFIVPVNFDEADEFSFASKMRYYAGNALKVYYSTEYEINGNIVGLNDITSEFTLSDGSSDDFIASGTYDLTGISGNGAIFFKYEGADGGVSTTVQLDDISIVDNDAADCGASTGGGDVIPPSGNAVSLFAGSDFEDWAAFEGGLNSYGLKAYATQSAGTGQDGSASLHIATDPTTTGSNDYVFTALANNVLPTSYSKISFYMKGSSTKSVSLNVYNTAGSYYKFNLGSLTESTNLTQASSNQYSGTIDTGGEWILVNLDLTGITDLNSGVAENLFALKIGKNADYDLHFDNFVIE